MAEKISLALEVSELQAALLLEQLASNARRRGDEEQEEWATMAHQVADQLAARPAAQPKQKRSK